MKKEVFDKEKELKNILLWLGIPVGVIAILSYFGIRDYIIGGLAIMVAVLSVSHYLTSKENIHLKELLKNAKKKKK